MPSWKREQFLAALESHLRTKDDIEMMLLKGHLILEQGLNKMLLCYIKGDSALTGLNLGFSKKLDMLLALRGPNTSLEEFDQLREINRIRNKLAHELSSEKFHVDLKRWACGVVGYIPKSMDRKKTYRNTLMKAFYILAGMLSGYAEGFMVAVEKKE